MVHLVKEEMAEITLVQLLEKVTILQVEAVAGGSNYTNSALLTDTVKCNGNVSQPTPSGGTQTGNDDNGYVKITKID